MDPGVFSLTFRQAMKTFCMLRLLKTAAVTQIHSADDLSDSSNSLFHKTANGDSE